MDSILEALARWSQDPDAPFDVEDLVELESVAARGMLERDMALLSHLRNALSPLSSTLQERVGRDPSASRAAGIVALTRLIRMALYQLEKEDPGSLVAGLRHAPLVLRILAAADRDLNLTEIQARWTDGAVPSIATLSRTVAALEEGGLVQRAGATRGRRVRLLARGREWVRGDNLSWGRVAPTGPLPPHLV